MEDPRSRQGLRASAGADRPELRPEGDAPPLLVSNPGIMGGEPVIRGARMPARRLLEYLEDGGTLDAFVEDYPGVERDDARAVLALLRDALPGLAARAR